MALRTRLPTWLLLRSYGPALPAEVLFKWPWILGLSSAVCISADMNCAGLNLGCGRLYFHR
jgi:hypothetical protein